MKRFLNIRNLLVAIIIAIAFIYVFFIRSNNPSVSRTSELFYKLINKDIITMNLSFKEEEKQGVIIISTDKKNNNAFQIIELYDYTDNAKKTNATHTKNITIRENKKLHTYHLNYDLKEYKDFGENIDNEDITNWIENLNYIVSKSRYYTKSYKTIDNIKMYIENFPELGYMFAYDGNELKYIKQKDGFSGDENTLYKIKFDENFIDNSVIEIPNDFILNN